MRLDPPSVLRRQVLAAALILPAVHRLPTSTKPCFAAEVPNADVAALLNVIPAMPFGAPATNVTLPRSVVADIESAAIALERLGQVDNALSPNVNGSWRLLYSNAREISNLASGLPLGFALGPTYQPLDVGSGRFENQGSIVHQLGVAKASTCVVGDVRVAPPGTRNAASTVNDKGNRVDVDFRRIVFSLDEFFGRPLADGQVRKIVVPTNDPGAAQPANDVTYLDATIRVTRGGDDSIFIFRREESPRPLLTMEARSALFAEGGRDVVTGKATIGEEENSSPELRKLLRRVPQ